MKTLRIVLVVAALLASVSMATAQDRAEKAKVRAKDLMAKLDTNGDGKISKEEFAAVRAGVFQKLDKNGDGYIEPNELPQAKRRALGLVLRRLKRMDTNGGGRISKDEWKGRPAVFAKLDRNADGFIEPWELRETGRRAVAGKVVAALKRMDTDGDGRISKKEWKGRPEVFAKLDRNGDGYIDKADRPAK